MSPRKEPSKNREWEKIRRDKLNNNFKALGKLLPNHDPSLSLSKLEILRKAAEYIEELQKKVKDILTAEGAGKIRRNEIKILYGRIRKLLTRNEQLCNLLKDAGIKIPTEYGDVKHFKEPLRWSHKFTAEQAKRFAKEEVQNKSQKENKIKKAKPKVVLKKTNVGAKHRKKDTKKTNKPISIIKKAPIISFQLSNIIPAHQTLPKASSQACFIITNNPQVGIATSSSQNKRISKASTVVTNSSSLAAPKMASTVKPPPSAVVSKATLNPLGPGTLILANGNIVPILPPILTNPTPILLKPPTNNTTLIVMPTTTSKEPVVVTSTSAIKSSPTPANVTKTLANIQPKINITQTTHINKVPIPAVRSRLNNCLIPDKSKTNKVKKVKRKLSTNNVNNNKKLKVITESDSEKRNDKIEEKSEDKVDKNADDVNKDLQLVPLEKIAVPSDPVSDPQPERPSEPKKVADVENKKDESKDNDKGPAETINDKDTEAPAIQKDGISESDDKSPRVAKNVERAQQKVVDEKADSATAVPTTASQCADANVQELGMTLNSELSNDLFSSLQVPIGGQNPESTSPTAAFLLAFPLVSSLTGVKVTEVIEEENSDSRHGTPTLLQIGTMDTTKTTQSVASESLTPNLLNLDNFAFFSNNNFYSPFENAHNGTYPATSANAKATDVPSKQAKSQSVKETSVPQISSANTTHYTATTQITKSDHNSFVPQTTVVPYSKQTTITSSYVPPHPQYNDRSKNTTITTVPPTCKNIGANKKPSDANSTATTTQYNTATSNITSVAQCNAFNPFSDFSKPSAVHSYTTFTKPYNDPLYTNSTYNYGHANENNYEQNMYYPSKPAKTNAAAYGIPNYPDPSAYNKRDQRNIGYYHNKTQTKHGSAKSSKTNAQPKPPINWMTTPDFKPQSTSADYLVPPPFAKDIEYNPNSFYPSNSFASTTHSSYFNTTSTIYGTPDFQNPIISTGAPQRNEFEENQFAWSPTKIPQFLETPHSFVSSTLPTLVGDLALGTAQTTFGEQKSEQAKTKESNRRSKAHTNYDNQSNFLSVSQLVENKNDPSSTRTNRRNSSNRNVKNTQKGNKHSQHKPVDGKDLIEGPPTQTLIIDKKQNLNYGMQSVENSNWMVDCNKTNNRHGHKNSQSSYSAEALIGHQEQSDSVKQRYRQQHANYPTANKALPIPTFLSDNIVSYFPPVEMPQDNNFMQAANSSYQNTPLTHAFSTSVQNYQTSGATITSSYLQTSSLIPEFGTHDFSAAIPDAEKHCNRTDSAKHGSITNRTEARPNVVAQQINTDCAANITNNFVKKSKHKHANETNLPGVVDFGFLSMPGTINSPILPDDFHTHSNFLPPPTPSQLYPCKNPLYPKQTSDLLPLPPVPVSKGGGQHFEGPTVVSNAGSSLTSFNLSAIFPEINKGTVPIPGLYSDSARNKNYNFQRNYLTGAMQVTFSNKSTTSSSFVNSIAPTYTPAN